MKLLRPIHLPSSAFSSRSVPIAVCTLASLGLLIYTLSAIGFGGSSRLTLSADAEEGHSLEWHGEEGQIYFIQKSTDLAKWKFVPYFAVGEDARLAKTFPSRGKQAFYRLVHSNDPESDLLKTDFNETGVSAWDHVRLGFDPFAWTDSTGNGIHDAWEMLHFNETGVDPIDDADDDGLSNRLEFLLGTNPHAPDAGVVGPSTPRGLIAYATSETVYLKWEPSLGKHPVNQYRLFRNGTLFRNQAQLEWTDTAPEPGQSYTYTVQARDTKGNLSELQTVEIATAADAALPAPWVASTVNARGHSAYHEEDDVFVLSGSSGEILKNYYLVHRQVDGDFRLSARVHMAQATSLFSKAGLAVTEDMTGAGRGVSYSITGTQDAQILSVSRVGAAFSATTTPGVRDTGWLGIERRGNLWTYTASLDGQHWFVVGESEIVMPDTVYLGLAVASNHGGQFATGAFSDVVFEDLNHEPLAGGSGGPDTDGDGIFDWEETYVYHTNPELHDIWVTGTAANLQGSQGVAAFGSWAQNGSRLISQTVKASVDYQIEITEAGIYRLEFELAAGHNATNRTHFPVALHLDGQLLERYRVHLPGTDSALIHAATPWLEPGTHTVRLHFDNTLSHRSLAVLGLRVQSLGGLDNDADGIPAWMNERLAVINSLDTTPTSFISPASLEGIARYGEFFRLNVDSEEVTPNPAPSFGWYFDVPLDPDAPTQISASFESGSRVESFELTWDEFNVLEQGADHEEEALRIRTGDSLLLTARDGEATAGGSSITIVRGGHDPVEYSLSNPATDAAPHLFEEAGFYTVTGSMDDGNGGTFEQSMLVEVVHARFNGDPVARAFPMLEWQNPLLPRNVQLVADSALTLLDKGPLAGGGSLLHIASSVPHPSHVIARLDDDGPIMHHATVHGIEVSSNANTAIDTLAVYADGSRLIGTPIMLNRITPDTRVEVEIFINGVTFEDGTTFKVFTAADFDEFGRIYVKFLLPASIQSAYCHRIYVHEGDTYLGSF